MNSLTITAKGQVTLHKDLLKHIGARPGDRLIVDKLPGARIEIKAGREMKADRPTGKISEVFGLLKKKNGPSLSIDEMNKIAAKGWAGKR
jgi:bifunctional DNA-binding transcriptional regulator/antitoxin component of YhaV-PrlF toxin-antitoxin module